MRQTQREKESERREGKEAAVKDKLLFFELPFIAVAGSFFKDLEWDDDEDTEWKYEEGWIKKINPYWLLLLNCNMNITHRSYKDTSEWNE